VLHPDSPVAQGRPLPRWARPVLVRRAGKIKSVPDDLQAGDRVYLLVAPNQVPLLDKLFGRMKEDLEEDASLYGDFIIGPEITVQALREAYDLPLGSDHDSATVSDLFRREFRQDLEEGDRVHLGPVDLIVREMRDGRIVAVGLSLDPRPPVGWEKVKVMLEKRLAKRRAGASSS